MSYYFHTTESLNNLFCPEFIFRPKCQGVRVAAAPLAAASGAVKPFVFPILATLGLVLMPILAGVKAEQGDVSATAGYLTTWGFCFLSLASAAAFIAVAIYTPMPLVWSSAIVISICALSVVIHVHKAIKEPKNIKIILKCII